MEKMKGFGSPVKVPSYAFSANVAKGLRHFS
jgi:hypothetical protein